MKRTEVERTRGQWYEKTFRITSSKGAPNFNRAKGKLEKKKTEEKKKDELVPRHETQAGEAPGLTLYMEA